MPKPKKEVAPSAERQSQLDKLFVITRQRELAQDVEWIEESKIDDNPYQPRKEIDPLTIEKLKVSINAMGQLQACAVRPHPTRSGRFQLVYGHRRRAAVAGGANAGIKEPKPHTFIGKLKCVVMEETDDLQMRIMAIDENENRDDLGPLDRARAYVELKDALEADRLEKRDRLTATTWLDVEKITGLSYRHMHDLAKLLDLPPAMQEKLDSGELNGKHGKALTLLQSDSQKQKALYNEIRRSDMSGSAAVRLAQEYRKQLPLIEDKQAEASWKRHQDEKAAKVAVSPAKSEEKPKLSLVQRVEEMNGGELATVPVANEAEVESQTVPDQAIPIEDIDHEDICKYLQTVEQNLVSALEALEKLRLATKDSKELSFEINEIRFSLEHVRGICDVVQRKRGAKDN